MKSRKIILASILGIFGLSLIIIFSLPKIISEIEYHKLENKVLEINKLLNLKTESKTKLEDKLTSNIFNYNNKDLEKEVKTYLKNIINISYGISEIENNNLFNNILTKENLSNENINNSFDFLNESNKKLINYKEIIDKIRENNKKYINTELINKYLEDINKDIEILDIYNQVLTYLNNNKEYYEIKDELIFLRKNKYLEYRDIVSKLSNYNLNIINYKMTKDDDVPIISPINLDIYVGSDRDLNNYIKCIDEIDGEVECTISGMYDLGVIGNYSVSVEARDSSSNYVKKNVQINVKEKVIGPYYTEVIRNHNVIIVYGLDENNHYTKIVKVFTCSTGRGGRTPTGTFYTTKGSPWGPLMGGVWGQYYTVITKNILFHSVPYYSMSNSNLEWEEYNKLGSAVSAGCVRLSVEDAKWIYDNCPSGMRVRIFDGDLPAGVSKPETIKIDENSLFRGWDPTDPDPNNPWKS